MVIFSTDNISVDAEVLLIPIFSSKYHHPIDSRLSVLGVSCSNGDLYVLPICHDEGNHKFPLISARKIWASDKKLFSYCSTIKLGDASSIEYILNNSIEDISKFYTSAHLHYYRQYSKSATVNEIIPLVKHAEMLKAYSSHLWPFISRRHEIPYSSIQFLSDIAIPTLCSIEKNGFAVDQILLSKFFKRSYGKPIIHGQYNLYTTTGRCSNKFDGINFASMNKSDGSRETFISRFGDGGQIVNIDFESFHLRLLADLIKYPLPKTSLHQFFGQQYFQKDVLSDTEYEESKRISFQYLYGRTRTEDVPEFFKQVYAYSDQLVSELNRTGCVYSPHFRKPIFLNNITEPEIILSYMMQLTETEVNLSSISKVLQLMDGYQSKPILYLYDSLIIDLLSDEKQLLKEIVSILEQNGKFPVKVAIGSNFHKMRRIK